MCTLYAPKDTMISPNTNQTAEKTTLMKLEEKNGIKMIAFWLRCYRSVFLFSHKRTSCILCVCFRQHIINW